MASGGIYGHAEEVGSPQLTVDEMRTAVEEAHKSGRKTAAHAYSRRAITNALDVGIDSIEHASFLDAELADRMRQAGIYIVPTLSTYQDMYDRGPELGTPDYILRKTADVLAASRAAFTLALETGVPIAAGTDSGAPGHPHGTLPDELRLMVGLGAIRCRQSVSAHQRPRPCSESPARLALSGPVCTRTWWLSAVTHCAISAA